MLAARREPIKYLIKRQRRTNVVRKAAFTLAALALAQMLTVGPTLAAGGGSSNSPKNPDLVQGAKMVESENYAAAIPLLEKAVAADPKSADAHNYLGYSHRNLGDTTTALGFYQKALALEPKHRGANEYLGELYLEMGELGKAEERLEVLDGACFFGCEEYSELKEAIKAYKAQQGS
jgi:tetratricopeptide (TPR) repeat protein